MIQIWPNQKADDIPFHLPDLEGDEKIRIRTSGMGTEGVKYANGFL